MLVDMYRIESGDMNKSNDVADAAKKVQLEFKNSPGNLGQRLLRDLQDPRIFVAVSYWRNKESLVNARQLHAAFDKALVKFKARTAVDVYEVVHELQVAVENS